MERALLCRIVLHVLNGQEIVCQLKGQANKISPVENFGLRNFQSILTFVHDNLGRWIWISMNIKLHTVLYVTGTLLLHTYLLISYDDILFLVNIDMIYTSISINMMSSLLLMSIFILIKFL